MTQPQVELLFHPTDLNPQDLRRAGQFLGSPAQAIEAGLGALRMLMVDRMKTELAAATGGVNTSTLTRIADLAWQAAFWKFRRISAPILADAYIRAYRQANAGDVPMAVIYDLADKHADRMGEYFHESSKQAMVEGFNSFVNRRMAAKVAADRVFDGYGLTSRQMRGYVAATDALDAKVNTPDQRSLKARVIDYVARSFRQRIRKFADQEEHNVDEQAKQLAWMWLLDKGRLNPAAEKMWITAKDEKVCPVCGPLHGVKVGINERFKTPDGEFWSPGVHPNCRCHVLLIENLFSKADWEEKLHPRDLEGKFARKRVTTATRTSPEDEAWMKRMRALAQADVTEAQAVKAPVKPQLTGPMLTGPTLRGQAMLSAPVPEAEAAPVQAPAEVPLLRAPVVGVRPQLTAPSLKAHVDLTVSPELSIETAMQTNPQLTQQMLLTSATAMNEAVRAVTKPTTATVPEVITRNTAAIPGDAATGDNLLYYYDPYAQALAYGNTVNFTTEEQWLKGEQGRVQIMAQIQKDTVKDIEARVHQVLHDDYEAKMQYHVGANGEEYINIRNKDGWAIEISRSELERIITDTAYKQEPEPLTNVYMWDADDPTEAYGKSYPRVPASWVLDTLYITPEQFEKTVYVADHGHHKQAMPSEGGVQYGFETWLNTGQFQVTDESTGAKNQGVARLTNVMPDVPIERHRAD